MLVMLALSTLPPFPVGAYMDLTKLNIMQVMVLAIEDVSLLFPNKSELKLMAGSDFLLNVSYEKMLLALEELEGEYGLIKIASKIPDRKIVNFFITDYHFIDSWAYKVRHDEGEVVGEIKVWGKLNISIDRAWLRYGEDPKINVSLTNKPMQLLLTLMDAKGKVISYADLAAAVDLSADFIDGDFSVIKESLKALKRDLGNYLIKAGLHETSASEIKNMIVASRNTGYLLRS